MMRRLLPFVAASVATVACVTQTSSRGSFSLLSAGRPGGALLAETYGEVRGEVCDDEAEEGYFELATRRALAAEPRANALAQVQFETRTEGTLSCWGVGGTAVRLRD
jgi:hypothetical protein